MLLAALLFEPCLADEQREREKLRQLSDKIKQLQQGIKHSSAELQTLNGQLQKNELRISSLQREIDGVTKSVGQLNHELQGLSARNERLSAARQQQEKAIAAEINANYRLGREQTLKLLLNQEDPEKVSRVMKYHDYFLQARAAKLSAYFDTLRELRQVETDIRAKKQRLLDNRTRLSQQKDALLAGQKKRQQVLGELRQSLQTDDQRLNQLLVERKRLESVIEQLEQATSSINLPSSLQPFAKLKGKLDWPTRGKLEKRFGSRRNTRIKWNGWLIAAPEGTMVKAIHHGRVVFADYLRGQGMLIIVDHGDGYMSLYAHNQVVLKETGDWVQPGEVIAKVGNTGGRQDTALYFEIRHKGRPTNPRNWLRG